MHLSVAGGTAEHSAETGVCFEEAYRPEPGEIS